MADISALSLHMTLYMQQSYKHNNNSSQIITVIIWVCLMRYNKQFVSLAHYHNQHSPAGGPN